MAKILIVDDRLVNRQFLVTLLGYQHHELFESSDGAEALQIARREHPDLIISDVLMPTMDGYEFVRRLREEADIDKTPVIFSTAHYLSRESHALAEKCGVTSIIYKPCEPQTVLDAVTAALQNKIPAAEPATPATEFDREHIRVLTDQLSYKAERLRDANGKLTALIELSTDLSKERDPVKLLDRYCSVVREVIGARWTLVALLEKDRKTIQHLGAVGLELDNNPALHAALMEHGVFATLMKEGRAISLSDVTSTPDTLHLPKPLPRADSLLVTPLAMRDQIYGWICLAGKLGLDAFSEQDEQLATALAAKMAVAYDNALLYSESLKYAGKLESEIAERTRVELQLSESKARLAGVIDSAIDAIITINSDQRVLMFNRAAEKMFKRTAAEALGQTLDRFIPPRFRTSHAKDIRRFGETGVTTRAMGAARAVSGLRANGEEFPVEASISQIEVGSQKLYTVIMRDITERKTAENARLKAAAEYKLLFEGNPEPMWVFDRETLRFLAVNQAAIDQYGFAREEFIKMTIEDIRPPEEIPKLRQAISHPTPGLQRSVGWKHRKKDGRIIDVEISSSSMDFNGRSAELVLANDVTERLRAQEALRTKSEELAAMTQQLWQASKLATMGELAASVAHELNNPLATVGLRAETLLMQIPEADERRRPLEVIAQEVDRMAGLVNNLLQFSRRSHRQVSTVDVREEIANSVEFVHYHLRTHKIEVIHEFQDHLPTIQADRQQLRQLFLNLLTNASDAMPNGGKLIVRALPARLAELDAVAVEFADSGEGITTENLEKIWEPFFTTKPEGKGTGLGLAICRRIVEEHGGTIVIESEPGSGATVRIFFPATAKGSTV